MSIKKIVLKSSILFTAALVVQASISTVDAAVLQSAFGDPYQAVPQVAATQGQVVYYREGTPGQKGGPAFVYINKEFHTGLLPGGYTVFCVAPGRHGMSSVTDDAPRYMGKYVEPGVRLEPGMTQFIRVSEAGSLEPQLVSRDVAERELAGHRRQAHVISRATTVQACDYVPQPEVRSYSISSDVLFGFAKWAYEDIRQDGRVQLNELLQKLRAENLKIGQIDVIGHTDRIGSLASNDALGLRRAQTVRQLLIDGGMDANHISASSEGSRQPMTTGCRGTRSEEIACLAPDRRVVIRVTGSIAK